MQLELGCDLFSMSQSSVQASLAGGSLIVFSAKPNLSMYLVCYGKFDVEISEMFKDSKDRSVCLLRETTKSIIWKDT
jgi:hypothetical protein